MNLLKFTDTQCAANRCAVLSAIGIFAFALMCTTQMMMFGTALRCVALLRA